MFLYRLQLVSPGHANRYLDSYAHLSRYHLSSELSDLHQKLWPKEARVLNPLFVDWFKQSLLWRQLEECFGPLAISDEDSYGWESIYWRLVRPNMESDVGPLHRDSWFWELNPSFKKPEYPFKRVKVWIAIITEPGLNGLIVVPGSHDNSNIQWHGEYRDGKQKPVLDTDPDQLNQTLIHATPGQCIIFDDNLLHGGAINRATTTRISLELTLLKRLND